MKTLAPSNIKSSKDLELRKEVLRSYISSEEKKSLGQLPSINNPIVAKVAGIVGALVLKAIIKRILK